MLVYYVTTVLGVSLASLAGSRALAGPEGAILPRRHGAPAVMAMAVLCLFVGVAGLRYRVGVDYIQYADSWSYKYSQFTWEGASYNSEPAFSALATTAAWFYNDSASMFFFASLVTVALLVATYAKYSPMFAISILLMVLVGTWHGSFNGVRQFLAAAIVLGAHRLILERRFKSYLLVVALATLFHFSAWVCLLLYFVPRRGIGFAGYALLAVVAVVAIGSYDLLGLAADALRGQEVTASAYFAERVSPLRVALAFLPFAVFGLFADRSQLSTRGHFYANVTLVHGVIYLISISSAYLARFAIYTDVFLALAWATLLAACPRESQRWLIPLVVVVYGLFWYLEVSPVSALNNFRWIWGRDA